MSTISVVIPTFNAEPFIEETLESVFNQSLMPDSIVIADDCSTDRTVTKVRELQKHSPVELILLPMTSNSGGPARPINAGIDASKSRFIALLDQDDIMLPNRLQLGLAACLKHEKASMALGKHVLFLDRPMQSENSGHFIPSKVDCKFIKDEFLTTEKWRSEFFKSPGIQLSCSNHFFPKSTWIKAEGYREKAGLASDYDFVLRAFGDGIAWIDDVLFRKRVHARNSWKLDRDSRIAMLRLQTELAKSLKDPNILNELLEMNIRYCSHARWAEDYALCMHYIFNIIKNGNATIGLIEFTKCSSSFTRATYRKSLKTIKGWF